MSNRSRKNHRDILLQTLLERSVGDVFSPLDNFIRKQTGAALLLVIATVTALALANLPVNNPIGHLSEIELGLLFSDMRFSLPLSEWINSGLMALFFFIIGLEIKRSIMAGTLHNPSNVSLIMIAAIGGMVVPGICYALLNYGGEGAHGWAIPMATDTAFAIGVLAILAKRISAGLSIFLVALAIFDDIGAILIIAAFYTEHMHVSALLLALIPLALLIAVNRMGITNGFVYAILGVILWFYVHESGIHATLAGLLLAFTVPAKTYLHQSSFIDKLRGLLDSFETSNNKTQATMLSSESQHDLTEEMHRHVKIVSTPLQRWELLFINPVSIIVLPLFALFNAGIILSANHVMAAFESSVMWGVVAGLVVGKPVGIILFTFIGLTLKAGKLPEGVSMREVAGVGMVAGVGFTMSVFISNLAFSGNPELIDSAKFGILLASFISACIALTWLFFHSKLPDIEVVAEN
jgi:NhaA family Na+:H+ antiporter